MTKNRAFQALDTTPGNDLVHAGRACGIENAAKAKARKPPGWAAWTDDGGER
jgi:hypothetical protein